MPPRHCKFNRLFFLLFVSLLFSVVILGKLAHLQIFQHGYFAAKAEEGHLGYSEVGARRGEILIKDYHSEEMFRLATNISSPLLYADPTLVKDPAYLADKLAPLIFDKELAEEKDRDLIRQLKRRLSDNPSQEELSRLTTKPEEELRKDFRTEIFEKLSQKTRQSIILYNSPPADLVAHLQKENISGIEVTKEAIVAHPPQISDSDYVARLLSPIIDSPYERLSELLKGRNRYVVLKQKTPPETEQQIRKLMEEDRKAKRGLFAGLGFEEKNYRYYPEGSLAAQVIGYISDQGGLYGIEKSFDTLLRGKKGIFKTQRDAMGQQVIVGDNLIIQPAIDGDSVTLTIDRSIQMEVEKRLAQMVKNVKADSGLVIIMEPKTGRIISLAHYPSFDPNEKGKAVATEDISLTEEEKSDILTIKNGDDETHYLYIDRDSNYRIEVFKEIIETGKTIVSKYKNILGPGVYRNRAVSDLYEPGSVFKPISMSIAIDDGDVTPQTTFNDTGPIEVDEFPIRNSLDKYYGIMTMTQVLEKSLNTGMAFVSRKMGRELFYRYLKKYGFGEPTYIEFEDEQTGKLEDPSQWAESELVTHAYGQGIVMTPVQLVTAMSVIANQGILMRPRIVLEQKSADGKITVMEPEQVRRVLTEKAAATVGAMMVSVVENGGASKARVPGYHMAGKTGTAQTYKNGVPLTGPGTTIASFLGFAPYKDPKFVMLVKIDRPRTSIWADQSASPLFGEIAQFLFKYYNIPPDT